MMVKAGLALVCAAGLGACGDGAQGDRTQEAASDTSVTMVEVKKGVEDLVRPEPGLYRTTVEVKQIDLPGAPPQVAQMLRGAMESGSAQEYCLTEADVEEGFREMARRSQQGDCEYQRFDVSGARFDAEMTCSAQGSDSVRLVMSGTGGRTSSQMEMTMQMKVPQMGEGTMRMTSRSERVGSCPG